MQGRPEVDGFPIHCSIIKNVIRIAWRFVRGGIACRDGRLGSRVARTPVADVCTRLNFLLCDRNRSMKAGSCEFEDVPLPSSPSDISEPAPDERRKKSPSRKEAPWGARTHTRAEQCQIKEKVLYETAAKWFVRHGYHGTSLADLATELGITKANLYNYVREKGELLYRLHLRSLAVADLAPGDVLILNWNPSTGDGRCARAGSAKSRSSAF